MDTEFEAKFYPVNKEKYRKLLKKLGARLVVSERKMRRAIIDHKFNPEFRCHYIRIRDEGNMIRLSAKTHAEEGGKLTDQKEIDVEVDNYDKTIRIFEEMGFVFDYYQENLRETWKYDGAEITIDTWPGLETYSEIEAESEVKVKEIAGKLGFRWEDKIVTSVKEIYAKVYNLSIKEVDKRLENLTFENNPFKK